jgi:hypothetical protein
MTSPSFAGWGECGLAAGQCTAAIRMKVIESAEKLDGRRGIITVYSKAPFAIVRRGGGDLSARDDVRFVNWNLTGLIDDPERRRSVITGKTEGHLSVYTNVRRGRA